MYPNGNRLYADIGASANIKAEAKRNGDSHHCTDRHLRADGDSLSTSYTNSNY
jgi:hypothetical protein